MKPTVPQRSVFWTLAGLYLATKVYGQEGLSIDVPVEVPLDASDEVDPDFLGLAFEQTAWVRYATDDAEGMNVFSNNLINAIYSRTGGKPIIRLGGTSPDYAKYLPGQQEPALPVSEQDNYQDIGGTTIGPSYWPIAKLFPNAKFMVQVPLATTNISETVAWAEAAVEGIGIDQIHSIQVGNEPDLYRDDFTGEGGMFLGPPDFQGKLNNETYIGNYTKYAAAIRDAIDLPDHFFTTFDVAAHVDTPWVSQWILDVETGFGLGIDADNIVKEVAHHFYQNHAGEAEDLESGLMTMNLTHTNLDYLKRHINWLKQNRPDVPFIINEIGNSLKVTNSYQYQARLGSALWAVDFYLYSLSIGVSRFNYQQIMHSGFDLWLPHASGGFPAQVFSNYYSQPFLADFVGSSGKTRVAKLDVVIGESVPNLAAYAAFEDGVVKRIAVANLGYWNRTSSTFDRPVASIRLDLALETDLLTVAHLGSPDGAGAGAETITYAGSQWTFESLGEEVKGIRNDTEEVVVENGGAVINVPASEAVIIYL
ncbi:unnamed protein product [Clonostachys rhizophaga]|uniref:Beta-glucuronidase C-terminal domain-containing protein n=1 Tax=Clonostachys rhizophaga TaxID=160324 RepID=A0A9N9YF07_9HYPO|nr:unnamed protein product [Clonostachys rhizophaga]